jgi:hypothetical protein
MTAKRELEAIERAKWERKREVVDVVSIDMIEITALLREAREKAGWTKGDEGNVTPYWLDLIMPNGKPLRDCTFGELNQIGLDREAAENAEIYGEGK